MFRRRSRPEADATGTDESLTSRRHAPEGRTLVRPSIAVVQQILDEFGLRHTLDDDGDLLVRWERASIYFFFYGEHHEVLQARLYLHRRFDVDSRTSLTLLLDEWNRTKLFPKAFTMLPDDGQVHVCAEHCHDFDDGATRAQLKHSVGLWIETHLRFSDWIDDQL